MEIISIQEQCSDFEIDEDTNLCIHGIFTDIRKPKCKCILKRPRIGCPYAYRTYEYGEVGFLTPENKKNLFTGEDLGE